MMIKMTNMADYSGHPLFLVSIVTQAPEFKVPSDRDWEFMAIGLLLAEPDQRAGLSMRQVSLVLQIVVNVSGVNRRAQNV